MSSDYSFCFVSLCRASADVKVMLLQSVLLFLLLTLCGTALTRVINSDDYDLDEDVICKDTEDCILVSKCASAVDTIDNKRMHHGYARCGWYGNEEVVCCPKQGRDWSTAQTRHGIFEAETACNNFTQSRSVTVQGQILEGEPADPGELPHMAALGYSENGSSSIVWGLCGGTLISYDYVLTAAHCLSFSGSINNVYLNLEIFAVRLGKLDIKGNSDKLTPQDLKVVNVYPFPQYDTKNKYNDIALLQLESSVTINEFVSPACLYLNPEDPEKYITVSGWGFTTPEGNQSHILLKTKLKAFDTTSCSDIYNKRGYFSKTIRPSQMCAVSYDDKNRDTCSGDSGGPAQITNEKALYVVGVTSFGECNKKPGVYTRVAHYVPWIESIVWPTKINTLQNMSK